MNTGSVPQGFPKGTKAKPYQVKQVRSIILKYRLGEMTDE